MFFIFSTMWEAFSPCRGLFATNFSVWRAFFYFMGVGAFLSSPLRKLLLAPMFEPMTSTLTTGPPKQIWFRKYRFTRLPITRWTHDFLVDLEDLAICMHRCDFTNSVPRNMSVHTVNHAVITWGDEHNLWLYNLKYVLKKWTHHDFGTKVINRKYDEATSYVNFIFFQNNGVTLLCKKSIKYLNVCQRCA